MNEKKDKDEKGKKSKVQDTEEIFLVCEQIMMK